MAVDGRTVAISRSRNVRLTVNQRDRANRLYRANDAGDIIALTWDILRLRRCKTGIINGDVLAALQSILEQLVPREDSEGISGQERAAEDLGPGVV
jgi:hypothetical protein